MTVADTIVLIFAIIALSPVVVLAIELLVALLPVRRSRMASPDARGPVVIIMPAHNEALGIAATIAALQPQLRPCDAVLVVADNCTDSTADEARLAGARVTERTDPLQLGKGYALAHAVELLRADPPETVVILDADGRAEPGAIASLVDACRGSGRPTQAIYLDSPVTGSAKERWSRFALVVKNEARPRGLHRLGLPCLLTGSGMAFPWATIATAELATGDLVEDMKLGLDLSILGQPPQWCPESRVFAEAAPNAQALQTQRTRWEHGHVHTMRTQLPRLLAAFVRRPRWSILGLLGELWIPPLSLMVMVLAVVTIVCLVLWQGFGLGTIALAALMVGWVIIGVTVLTTWFRFGRGVIPLKLLVMLPIYVLWKLPIYLRLLITRQKTWVRTERRKAD